jgi:hypothetical protein
MGGRGACRRCGAAEARWAARQPAPRSRPGADRAPTARCTFPHAGALRSEPLVLDYNVDLPSGTNLPLTVQRDVRVEYTARPAAPQTPQPSLPRNPQAIRRHGSGDMEWPLQSTGWPDVLASRVDGQENQQNLAVRGCVRQCQGRGGSVPQAVAKTLTGSAASRRTPGGCGPCRVFATSARPDALPPLTAWLAIFHARETVPQTDALAMTRPNHGVRTW